MLDNFIVSNSYTKENYSWLEKPRGAFLNTGLCNLDYSINNNVILIGETLGATYPATGEGIGKAMETGYMAAQIINEAIKEGDLSKLKFFPDILNENIGAFYRAYKVGEKLAARNRLRNLFFIWAGSSRTIKKYIGDILSERKRAQDIKLFRFIYKVVKFFYRIKIK